MKNIDEQILIFINQKGSVEYDGLWLFITNGWNWIPFFLFILIVAIKNFSKRETWRLFYYTLFTLFVTALLTGLTKELVARPRPLHTEALFPYLRIITTAKGYSFFSGHTSNSFAICTFLYLVFRNRLKYAFWLYIWAVPYAYSRLYLGAHYPSDVLVGSVVGVSVAIIFYKIYCERAYHNKFS